MIEGASIQHRLDTEMLKQEKVHTIDAPSYLMDDDDFYARSYLAVHAWLYTKAAKNRPKKKVDYTYIEGYAHLSRKGCF